MSLDSEPRPPDEEHVPFFETWPRIYVAVVVCAVAVMGLIALFSAWGW